MTLLSFVMSAYLPPRLLLRIPVFMRGFGWGGDGVVVDLVRGLVVEAATARFHHRTLGRAGGRQVPV